MKHNNKDREVLLLLFTCRTISTTTTYAHNCGQCGKKELQYLEKKSFENERFTLIYTYFSSSLYR